MRGPLRIFHSRTSLCPSHPRFLNFAVFSIFLKCCLFYCVHNANVVFRRNSEDSRNLGPRPFELQRLYCKEWSQAQLQRQLSSSGFLSWNLWLMPVAACVHGSPVSWSWGFRRNWLSQFFVHVFSDRVRSTCAGALIACAYPGTVLF